MNPTSIVKAPCTKDRSVRQSRGILQRGFTLLELMIVLMLITVLVAMAVPSYQQYMIRNHRASAIETLLSTASCQQHIYAAEFRYDTRRCIPLDPSGKYEFRIEPENTASTTVFTLVASPLGTQQQDLCKNLSLNQSGWRGISGQAELERRCWEGR